MLEVENRFEDLEKHPEYYSFIDTQNILRDVAINKFPYVLIYRIVESEVRIYSVFNTGKKPNWSLIKYEIINIKKTTPNKSSFMFYCIGGWL